MDPKVQARNSNILNVALYSIVCIALGSSVTSLGPIFVYLAAEAGKSVIDYSFMFMSRSAGFITGALTVKIL